MGRVQLGSRWGDIPLIVRALMLQSSDPLHECDTCGATWHHTESIPDNCRWCANRRQADAEHLLKPPAPRGYGYATANDLAALGYDLAADREHDMARWKHDLNLGIEAGLITQGQGERAWESATKMDRNSSTSSTGTTYTTTPTTKKPSSPTLPFVAAGQLSPAQRKRANRPSSLPSRWKPQNKGTS